MTKTQTRVENKSHSSAEHEIDVSNKLVWRVIMSGTPLVEFGPDHRQIHRPLNDLVVMTSLCEKAAALRIS